MANPFNFGGGVNSVPAQPAQDWQLQSQGLNRKRALMDALMAQNMAPTPIQQVSGRVVNNGLLDGFSKVAMALALKGGYDQADKAQADIQSAALARQAQARSAMHAGGAPKDIADIQSRAAAAQGIDPAFNPWADEGFKTWLDIFKQNEIEKGKTDKWGNPIKGANDQWVQFGDRGGVRAVQGYQPPPEIDIVNGVVVDKSKLTPGSVAPQNLNDLVIRGADGTPQTNDALLDAKKQVAASGASNISIGAPVAVQMEDGTERFVQFPNKPGAAPVVTPYSPPASGKMSASTQQQRDSLDALDGALGQYEAKMRNFDPRSLNQLSPEARADIESAHARVIMALKEADRLGALQKPDLEIMEKAVTNPASIKGAVYGEAGLAKQIANARTHAKNLRSTIAKNYGGGKKQGPTDNSDSWQDVGGGVKIRKVQ